MNRFIYESWKYSLDPEGILLLLRNNSVNFLGHGKKVVNDTYCRPILQEFLLPNLFCHSLCRKSLPSFTNSHTHTYTHTRPVRLFFKAREWFWPLEQVCAVRMPLQHPQSPPPGLRPYNLPPPPPPSSAPVHYTEVHRRKFLASLSLSLSLSLCAHVAVLLGWYVSCKLTA